MTQTQNAPNNPRNNPHLELSSESTTSQTAQDTSQNSSTSFSSVYPKIPYQEQPPSYTATVSGSITTYSMGPHNMVMPQPESYQQQYSYPAPPGPPPPLQPSEQLCHHQQNYQPQLPQSNNFCPAIQYGSVSPPQAQYAPPIINNHSNITIEPVTALKTSSKLVQCPHCQQIGYTKLVHGYGACTGVSFASLLFLGCSPITFLIPFFFPWFQDVIHRCPSCNEEIAKFTKLDRRLQVNSPITLV